MRKKHRTRPRQRFLESSWDNARTWDFAHWLQQALNVTMLSMGSEFTVDLA
jgi:hypothetical protein